MQCQMNAYSQATYPNLPDASSSIQGNFGTLQNHSINYCESAMDACKDFVNRVHTFVFENRHLLFFVAATYYASVSYQSYFTVGALMGFVSFVLSDQICRRLCNATICTVYRPITYEVALAQTTLGTLSLFEQGLVYASHGHIGPGEGITASLFSGILTGAYVASCALHSIERLRTTIFGEEERRG